MTDWNDKEQVLKEVSEYGPNLQYVSDELKADREIVMVALQQGGSEPDPPYREVAFKYASDELKADREIVLAAVQRTHWALQYASEEFRADREIIMAAVQNNGRMLFYASDELKADREIVLAAVSTRGSVYELRKLSDELKADREIVLAAVQRTGWALQYASEELRADREIVMVAVQNDGRSIEYASEELKADPEIIQNSSFRNPLPLYKAGEQGVDYSNLQELNEPKEFQALRKRWQECLEKIEALKGEETDADEHSVDCASATFRIGNWCWHPCLEKSQYDDADRLGQHFGGPMYTCEEYPWPADDEGCAYPPVVQIDLEKVSALVGVFLGDGLLQLFYDGDGDYEDYERYYTLRRIPRASISEELMTPLPEDFDEFQTFKLPVNTQYAIFEETYSHCSVITGFKKGDFQIEHYCRGQLWILAEAFKDSDSSNAIRLGAEINQLHDDLLKFIEQTEPEFRVSNLALPGGESQLFGVVGDMNQITSWEQAVDGSMPFLNVVLPFNFSAGEGVIYIHGPNEFSWYCDW
jgi:hypothetical protein